MIKRSKPKQHVRKLKSGKRIVVNRGVNKSKRARKVFRGIGVEEANKLKKRGYMTLEPVKGREKLFLTTDSKVAKYFAKGHNMTPLVAVADMKDEDVDKYYIKNSGHKIIAVTDQDLEIPVINISEVKNSKKEDLYQARLIEAYQDPDVPKSNFGDPDFDFSVKKEPERAAKSFKEVMK